MSSFIRQGNRLIRSAYGETLRIEPWGPDGLRVRATHFPDFQEEDWALLPQPGVPAEIEIGEKEASVRSGRLTARVLENGKLFFYNQRGELLLEEYVRNRDDLSEYCSPLNLPAREFRPITGGDYRLTVRFEARDGERIYGMGQYQHGYLDQKGCVLELAHRNTQASVPFLLSSLGYGFLWNNPAVGAASFGKNLTEWTARCTKELDYWVTAGDTPAQIEERYSAAVGRAPLMPEFATGFWQSKLRYQTQEELLGVAREYKKRGLPLSVIVVDFFHWTNHGEWKFDPKYWPDPAGMVRELNEMGVELAVSVWPTVAKDSENYGEMLRRDYLVKTDRGQNTSMEFMGNSVFFDATDPGARGFVWDKVRKNYYEKGIHVFWLDEAEPEYGSYDFDLYRYHAGTALETGNLYPLFYAKAFYDGLKAEGRDDIVNLIRCAWAGSARYGALVWSGDVDSSFRGLREQFAAGLNMGLAGIPWWTTDIGGFLGGNPDDPAFRECLVRWFEYGVFCPVCRLHGERLPHREPIGTTGGGKFFSGAGNEVWSFGPEVYGILRRYLFLRERLRPYVGRLMAEAHGKGSPVIRPLFYDFPGDERAWETEDEYLFGPDVLVAPVMRENARSRKVYLPAGRWRDTHTGSAAEGGRELECEAPLDVIPVFVRADSALDFRI